jgi:hypothetical protein
MKRGFTSPCGRWRWFSAGRDPSHLHLHRAAPGGVLVDRHRGAVCRSGPFHGRTHLRVRFRGFAG